MVELKKITKDNFEACLNLKVADNQARFVASNIYSLAQAWVYQNTAFPFAIYADNILVGFIMMGYYEVKNNYTIWRFMIDEKYQNKGYGKKSLRLAINYLVENFKVNEVLLSVEPNNHIAKNLYTSLGFNETGELEGSEIEMKLVIND